MAHAEGSFEIVGWDEDTYAELGGGRKLTQAEVRQKFTGDLEGEGSVRWQMAYRPDGTADWIGMQQVTGTLAGRNGIFLLQSVGTFDGSKAAGDWRVLAGSGTDGLEGISGRGTMEAPMGSQAFYSFDYEL
jgi:Protein of unknown function (DUF3224)